MRLNHRLGVLALGASALTLHDAALSGAGQELRVKLLKADAACVFHAITLTRWPDDLPAIAPEKGRFGQRPFSLRVLPAEYAEPGNNLIQHWAVEPTDVAFDKADNSLILRGRGTEIEALANGARLRDVDPRSVTVKVEFVRVPHGYLQKSGYRYIWQRAMPAREGPTLVGIGSGNVVAGHRGFAGYRVINAPLLRTKEGRAVTCSSSFAVSRNREPITLPVGLVVIPRV